jgi:hypothetical protein
MPPGAPLPAFPEEDLPQFPVHDAEALAALLVQVAAKLEDMIGARTQSVGDLNEFEGTVADLYREDLDAHAAGVADVVEQFRSTASRLRGAISDHEEARSHMITLATG